jgi:hypothetical protein
MGLKQSGLLIAQMPLRHHGGAVSGERNLWGRHELRNTNVGQGITEPKAGIPSGYRHPGAWLLPMKPGALSSRKEMQGVGSLAAAGAMGVNASLSVSATGSLAATGALIVSGAVSMAATGALSANVVAALAAAVSMSASGTLQAALNAAGYAATAMSASGSLTITSYATGSMSMSIAPAVTLEAEAFSAQLLDSELVEIGMTVREALRLITAAVAGKISGGGTGTITIRNAVADDKDRIVATVESDGDRTAITYDLTG